MPTIFRINNKYSVKVIPGDHRPPHVHIVGAGCEAKFTLDPVKCYYSRGFTSRVRETLRAYIEERKELCLEAWNDINED